MAINPLNHDMIYACANTVVNQSTDGGASWSHVSGAMPANVFAGAIIIDPTTPTTLYLGSNVGLFKTTDGGTTWPAVVAAATFGNQPITSLAIDPQHPQKLYAGTSGAGAYRSTDSGASWTVANTGFTFPGMSVTGLAVDAANGTVYAS